MNAIARGLAVFWNSPRWVNVLANGVTALGLLTLVGAGSWWLSERPTFRIQQVQVKAAPGFELKHLAVGPLQQQLSGYLKAERSANFFRANLDRIRELSEGVPWVRHARIRRVWPDGLEVRVEEHEALALWDDGRIVSTYGELFSANLAEAEEDGALPEFSGPLGTEKLVVSRFAELRRLLVPLNLQPLGLSLSTRQAWSAELSDGSKLLMGRDQGLPIDERVQRWVAAYPQARAKLNARPELIDLRYPNGFALGDFSGGTAERATLEKVSQESSFKNR
jgi:cell division protein FtsQ